MFHQGALVPLSDEILEHRQTEGCCMLAERLAPYSGANVKMISGKFHLCLIQLWGKIVITPQFVTVGVFS